jgi:hypothetical protein
LEKHNDFTGKVEEWAMQEKASSLLFNPEDGDKLKQKWNFNKLHGIITQKTILFQRTL